MKMTYKIKFVLSKYRKNRYKKVQDPVERSKYVEQLFKIGAGWNEQKTS